MERDDERQGQVLDEVRERARSAELACSRLARDALKKACDPLAVPSVNARMNGSFV